MCALLLVAHATTISAQGFQSDKIRGRLLFDFGPTVNRIEGIPLFVGAAIQTIEDRPFFIEARTIVRVEDGIPAELDRVGFRARLEKALADHQTFSVGLAGWSEVSWIEERGLSNIESSLATLVFKDDRRDYYEGMGFAAYGRVSPADASYRGVLQYQFERSTPLSVGAVSSLLRNDRSWPLQPLASEGDLHSLTGLFEFDNRPTAPDGPFSGWFLRVRATKGIGGSLATIPVTDQNNVVVTNIPDPDRGLVTGTIDIRRYNALGDLSINLRVTAGGSLKDRALPPQFQYSLGGTGTVPGYDLHELDCGARSQNTLVIPVRPTLAVGFYRYYGCDRFVLAQAEIIGYFGFRIATGENRSVWDGPSNLRVALEPRWVLFTNTARGWTLQDQTVPFATDTDWIQDVGAGILFGNVGVYGAYPLTGNDKKIKAAFRLQRRF